MLKASSNVKAGHKSSELRKSSFITYAGVCTPVNDAKDRTIHHPIAYKASLSRSNVIIEVTPSIAHNVLFFEPTTGKPKDQCPACGLSETRETLYPS